MERQFVMTKELGMPTCAILVMKKGSHALKNSPNSTPSVRLAFSAFFPCL